MVSSLPLPPFRRVVVKAAALSLCATGALAVAPAAAADGFDAKQVTIVVGFAPGGVYDQYARLMAAHLHKHLPGGPTAIVQNMPGAGGLKAAGYTYNVMAKTGAHSFMPPDSMLITELLRPETVKFKSKDFAWLGTSTQTNSIIVVRKEVGVTDIEGLRSKPVVIGSTGSSSSLVPALVNGVLGAKMKIVSGYKGSKDVVYAMEQREVDGSSYNWLAWTTMVPQWLEQGTAIPLVQIGMQPDPAIPQVPMLAGLVKPEDRPAVQFVATLGVIGRGLVLPPGVKLETVTMWRKAMDEMMASSAYVADARKRGLRVQPTPGAEIQKMIDQVVAEAKPEVIEKVRAMVFPK